MNPVCRRDECPYRLEKGYRREMKLYSETPTAWHWVCEVCESIQVKTKDKVGGTFGSGVDREDGRRTVVGRGF